MITITQKLTGFILFTLLFSYSYGQTPPVEEVDSLKKQKAILRNMHPYIFNAAEILEIKKIDKIHSKVIFISDSIYHEAIINSSREDLLLVETAHELTLEELPDIVKDAFKRNSVFANAVILKSFEISRAEGENLFRLDILRVKTREPSEEATSNKPPREAASETTGEIMETIYYTGLGHVAKGPSLNIASSE